MSPTAAILVTLVIYKLTLIAIGIAANRLSTNTTDYFLGGRRLGPWVASLSASASSSSAWTLIGVSGYAYAEGLSAIWLFPGCVGGFALNWFVLAPRLRRHSHRTGAITVTEVLAGPADAPLHRTVVQIASAITLACLLTYVAAQFQGAGKAFADTFDLSFGNAVLIGSGVVVFYTLLGGFWAVSITDTIQGLVMLVAAVVLPVAALIEVGGLSALWERISEISTPGYNNPLGAAAPAIGIGVAIGLLGIGLGYPGQPHVVNRFMASRDEAGIRQGRRIAMGWAVATYAGMILLGLCTRTIIPALADQESAFVAATNHLLPPVAAGIMIAAALSAIMSTADSQLLVAASSVNHDLARGPAKHSLARSRAVVLLLATGAVLVALHRETTTIFSNVLSAWAAMGAAFGPALLVIVHGRRPSNPRIIAAMIAGFVTSVGAHLTVDTARGFWEGVVPFGLALGILTLGRRHRG